MKSLKSFIRERLIKSFEEYSNPFHIIIEIDKMEFEDSENLFEGIWKPSKVKNIWQRVDKPKFEHEKLHIHLANKKHINTKSKQVSWNDDGTRHDKMSFNDNFSGIESAKQIARDVLNIPSNKIVEYIENKPHGLLILENVEYLPKKAKVLIFKIVEKNNTKIIHS